MSDKKKRPPYLLIVLLPLLGVGIWLLFADRQAREEAQAAYEYCGGVSIDIHGLDRDKDGSAFESLP